MAIQNLRGLLNGVRGRYLAVCLGLALQGCSPTFNWREVALEGTAVNVMLPCKPDQAHRPVPVAGLVATLRMSGCDTGGATFAVSWMDLANDAVAGQAIDPWKQSILGNMQAAASSEGPWDLKNARPASRPMRLTAKGVRPGGGVVYAQAGWFILDRTVFHLAVFSADPKLQAAEDFFSGVKLP